MKILVLGGHGFIGSHIVEVLIASGHNVSVYSRKACVQPGLAGWFEGDFLDKERLGAALSGVDTVIHAITTTKPATSANDPIYDVETNLVGTLALMKLMEENNVKRLVYLSSGGTVYGNQPVSPIKEETPLMPISNYGATKAAIENFINVRNFNGSISAAILRVSNPYGEGQKLSGGQGVIPAVLNNVLCGNPVSIFGDGSTIRDYLYIKDLARLVSLVALSDSTGIFNAGSGVGTSILEILEAVEEVTGNSILKEWHEGRPFDVKEVVLDCSKTKETFNWNPSVGLLEGISRQYEWLVSEQKSRSSRSNDFA